MLISKTLTNYFYESQSQSMTKSVIKDSLNERKNKTNVTKGNNKTSEHILQEIMRNIKSD